MYIEVSDIDLFYPRKYLAAKLLKNKLFSVFSDTNFLGGFEP
jgi:hypothetical protein